MPNEAPGFKFNPYAMNHLFIFLGPVIQELANYQTPIDITLRNSLRYFLWRFQIPQ